MAIDRRGDCNCKVLFCIHMYRLMLMSELSMTQLLFLRQHVDEVLNRLLAQSCITNLVHVTNNCDVF